MPVSKRRYRDIKPNEQIRKFDEIWNGSEWVRVGEKFIGTKVLYEDFKFRRKTRYLEKKHRSLLSRLIEEGYGI